MTLDWSFKIVLWTLLPLKKTIGINYDNTIRCRHPAGSQDLIPLQRLHVFGHSRDPHPVKQLWCQVPFTKSKTIFQIEMYCMKCFLKSKYIEIELLMIKIGESLRKLWSWRSCFLILPPEGHLLPRGLKVQWSVTWANIGVPSSDVPAEVELLHMRIELREACAQPMRDFVTKQRRLSLAGRKPGISPVCIIRTGNSKTHTLQFS